MDFIIQNIGWFVGIAVVIILALIGSYADKKEKKQLANNKQPEPNKIDEYQIPETNNEPYQYQSIEKTITSEEQIQSLNSEHTDIDEALYAPLDNTTTTNLEQQETVDPSLYAPLESLSIPTVAESIITDSLQQPTNEILEQQILEQPANEPPMEFNNIENLNMSLEDLEKKNYDKILNKKIEQEELIPDFTNSDDYLDETLANENYNHVFDNEIEQNPEEQNVNIAKNMQESEEIQETAAAPNDLEEIETGSNQNNSDENISQVNNTNVTEPTIENEMTINENKEDIEKKQASSEEKTIQNYVQSEPNTDVENQNDNQQENIWEFNASSPQLNGEILEQFNQIEQPIPKNEEIKYWEKLENNIQEQDNLNLYNDQLDDDIWKF